MLNIYIFSCHNNKYYVHLMKKVKGIIKHVSNLNIDWLNRYPPLEILDVIKDCNSKHVDDTVIKYMDMFGIMNVRGGSFCHTNLSKLDVDNIVPYIDADNGCVFCKCKEHTINMCDNMKHLRNSLSYDFEMLNPHDNHGNYVGTLKSFNFLPIEEEKKVLWTIENLFEIIKCHKYNNLIPNKNMSLWETAKIILSLFKEYFKDLPKNFDNELTLKDIRKYRLILRETIVPLITNYIKIYSVMNNIKNMFLNVKIIVNKENDQWVFRDYDNKYLRLIARIPSKSNNSLDDMFNDLYEYYMNNEIIRNIYGVDISSADFIFNYINNSEVDILTEYIFEYNVHMN